MFMKNTELKVIDLCVIKTLENLVINKMIIDNMHL